MYNVCGVGMCIWVRVSAESERGCHIPCWWSQSSCGLPDVGPSPNSGLLQEQCVLLPAEPSLHPCKFNQQVLSLSFKICFISFQIYQIYSKRSAEDIYKILTSYKANYLIVEDAICNEMGTTRGCRVKDLLDIANGHVSAHLKSWLFWLRSAS